MPPGYAVVLKNELGQPFRNGEAFILAVRDRLEEARSDILPIMVGNPPALRSENALKNNAAMTDVDGFVETDVPPCSCIEGIHHTFHAVGRFVVQGKPATTHDSTGLTNLLRSKMRIRP